MSILSSWSISRRLKLLMGLLLALSVLVGGMGWYFSIVANSAFKSLYDDRLIALKQLSVVEERTLHNRLIVTQAAFFPENHAKYHDELKANMAEISKNIEEYLATYLTEEEKKLADKMTESRKRFLEEALNPTLEYMIAGDTAKIVAILDNKFNKNYDELKTNVDALIQLQLDEAQKINQSMLSFTNTMTILFIIVMLLGGGSGLLLGNSIIGGINRSLTELKNVMTIMAKDGNLTARSKVYGKGEIGQSAIAFNSLIDSFADIIKQVNENAAMVSSTASHLAVTSRQIETTSNQQSSAAAATAASVEEITVSINSVADNTVDVRKLSEQSLQQTQQGNQSVSMMISEINQIQESVNSISDSVHEFVQSATAISGMTQQVKDIADQTNLLALNAAIEAARAGEQGRGFAVVADEVRKLAEKSGATANQIDQVTSSLTTKSSMVDSVVKKGMDSLKSTQQQIAKVSALLNEAGEAVKRSTIGVSDISNSVNEQSSASSEIARHVEQIAQMSEETHAAIKSSADEIEQLEKLAQALQTAVSKFKV